VVERVVTDIAAEVRDILVFHLGAEDARLTDDARLAEDLGADRLDLVEIAMSCEERFDIDIPNQVAIGLATVGEAVRFVQVQVTGTRGATTGADPARRPVRPRLELLVGEALHACARLARRRDTRVGSRAVAMRAILMLAVAGLVAFVLQPVGAAAETGYAAVWRPGSGAQWVRSGMTFDEFKAQDQTYFNQGLRIKSLALRGGRFTVVWQPGSGAQWVRWGMTFDEFKAQDQTYFNQSLRVAVLEIDDGRFAAVWRPGSGAQWVRAGMTAAELEAQDQTYFGQGLRLTAMAIENGRYAAVWQPGSGTQWVRHSRCFVDFKTEDAAYFGQGLRLGFVKLQDQVAGAWRYPWKSGDSRTVAQGNNNAAGSHNGSQAYAFDFTMPVGTQIRAVRAGTVEWLQENLTKTYDPTQPTTASNTPFPNGSLQNWGNAVRLRHPGGFTSWYFHIQPNGVIVKVGDKVQSGQPIANSGNIGRTSGPHLHFQVQADSTDWGQSVPIAFGNCEVPTTGATVTSDNANSNFP
jgi:acyl carrier protein